MTTQVRPIGAASTDEVLRRFTIIAERFLFDVTSEINRPDQQDLAARVVADLIHLRVRIERDGVGGERIIP